MSDDDLLDRLPTSYAVALRLERDDASAELISRALGLPVEAVPGHLAVAHAKLAALGHGSGTASFE
ncbi:hypothetical protein IF188_15930 [Microbacterium sp. NEAU-LLC]|uniref:RNA polymerase subunit sigma-24 n=1 Tax=Microbacterium helvum TaxID=2773713 RepID=A0ABR8NT38_9MICO|nr:hypothetical protein [Microbacterium helvum]MBD3943183.1 hypothetical protein [Microbacterium helvum]